MTNFGPLFFKERIQIIIAHRHISLDRLDYKLVFDGKGIIEVL